MISSGKRGACIHPRGHAATLPPRAPLNFSASQLLNFSTRGARLRDHTGRGGVALLAGVLGVWCGVWWVAVAGGEGQVEGGERREAGDGWRAAGGGRSGCRVTNQCVAGPVHHCPSRLLSVSGRPSTGPASSYGLQRVATHRQRQRWFRQRWICSINHPDRTGGGRGR